MTQLVLPRRFTQQPQQAIKVAARFASRLKFAFLPSVGFANLGRLALPLQTSGDFTRGITPAGITYLGGARAEYAPLLDASNGITLISIWRARPAQYGSVDSDRYLLGNRPSGNTGWSWGRLGAIGGGATGNLTSQLFVMQGIAAYQEANNTIESLVDTPVAVRYSKQNGLISWFRFGQKSSPDTVASTTPSAGGNLVLGAQGDFASGYGPWIDHAAVVLGLDGELTDAEIKALTESTAAPWQAFQAPARRIWVSAGAPAGTTYNVSIAETASAVDVLSAILAGLASIAETGAALDTSSAAMTATASVAETGIASDASSAALTTSASIAESGSATDSTSTGGATTSASIAETGAAAETTGAALIGTASVAETGAATDAQSGSTVLTATRSDALTAADTTSTGGAITSAAVAETAVATDSTSAIAAFLASVAEFGTALDSQSATAALNAAWSDALNATDTQNWGGSVISVSLSEALNALDSQSASAVFAASVTESGAALDFTSCVLIANASISEVLAALDSTSVQLITSASITEALSALDATSIVNLNFIAAKEHILTGRERSTVLVGRERVTVLIGKERILVIY